MPSSASFTHKRRSLRGKPYYGLDQYPKFGTVHAFEYQSPRPHLKAFIYHGLNSADNQILRGEALLASRLSIARLRLARLLDHDTAPVTIPIPLP